METKQSSIRNHRSSMNSSNVSGDSFPSNDGDYRGSSRSSTPSYLSYDSDHMARIQAMMFGLDRLSINGAVPRRSPAAALAPNQSIFPLNPLQTNSAIGDDRVPVEFIDRSANWSNFVANREILIDGGCDFVSKCVMTVKGCEHFGRMMAEEGWMRKEMIITKVMADLPVIMVHGIGYRFAKIVFSSCDEQQMSRVLQSIVVGNESGFVHICCSSFYGMEAVKLLIVNLRMKEQILVVTNVIIVHIVTFTNCCHGQELLKFFIQACNDYLCKRLVFNAMAENCTAIARNQMGCRVLQHCICPTYFQGGYLALLLNSIIINALILAEDRYGNYVVQHVMEAGIEIVRRCIVERLEGKFSDLAKSKFGSNVVEKCLKVCEVSEVLKILDELSNPIQLLSIAQHPFGNYVLQAALAQARRRPGIGELYRELVKRINVYSSILQICPYGRIVLHKIVELNTKSASLKK